MPSRVAMALGVIGGLAVLLVVVGIVSNMTGGSGALVITVAGPGSSEVKGIEVLVDGDSKCASSPCRIEALSAGTHLVKVRGQGFQETTSLAATIESGSETSLHVPLSRTADDRPAAPAAPVQAAKPADTGNAASTDVVATKGESKKAGLSALQPKAGRAALMRSSEAKPVADKLAAANAGESAPATDKANDGFGILRINSLPLMNVAVDGKPVGSTPTAVRVPAGTHRVVFVGKDERRAQTVNVASGQTQVVSVRF